MLSIRQIGVIGRTYRHLNRYRQILSVFFKFGFGDLIERLSIDAYLEIGMQMISRKRRDRVEKLTRAQRLRMAIEELGPTYIKLGQILSTRPDLIPAEFVVELSKLQDEVPPHPFEEIRAIIESELQTPIDDLFSRIDAQPIASASIGQVHKGRLLTGEAVAIKVQRPGIEKVVEVDLEIMLHLATLMERHVAEMALHRPINIVEEFARTLEKEMDYGIERANLRRFSLLFAEDTTTYIPEVYPDYSTQQVLTMQFVSGIKISHLAQLDAAGLDKKLITKRGADLILRQVFVHGFFHADPHPGNLFVLPDNVICLLDFGMVGMVDRDTRERFVELMDAVVKRDASMTTQTLLQLTSWDQAPDARALERDVADYIGRYFYRPIKEIELGKSLKQLIELVSRYQLRIPPDFFLMIKVFATLEGVARQLDPDFDMVAQAKPFVAQVKLERYAPQRIAQDAMNAGALLMRFAENLPKELLEILHLARKQQLKLTLTHKELPDMLATHDQISNRIAFSIIIAALIIGSALIVISKTPPIIYGISLIGIIGFFAAAIMGVWLLVAILKKGKL